MSRFVFDDVAKTGLLSINDQNRRGHWARKACTDYWHTRHRLNKFTVIGGADRYQRASITVTFRFPTDHRRDTANLYPTAKALIDIFVTNWGLLPDDDDRYVSALTMRRDPERGPLRVTVDVEEVTP